MKAHFFGPSSPSRVVIQIHNIKNFIQSLNFVQKRIFLKKEIIYTILKMASYLGLISLISFQNLTKSTG